MIPTSELSQPTEGIFQSPEKTSPGRTWCLWAMSVFVICIVSSGCGPSQSEIDKQKQASKIEYEKDISDSKALMPGWYRSRYKPWSDKMLAPVSRANPLLMTIWLLGLALYPLWSYLVVSLFGGFAHLYGDDKFWVPVFVSVGGLAVCLVANALLSWIFYSIIYLVLSLFSNDDLYVPWGFVSYCFHAFVHLTGMALMASLSVVALVKSQTDSNGPTGKVHVLPTSSGNRRVGFAVRAMAKAFAVAIATGVGSQLGGWLGGIVVFALAAGVSAFFGVASASSDDSAGKMQRLAGNETPTQHP